MDMIEMMERIGGMAADWHHVVTNVMVKDHAAPTLDEAMKNLKALEMFDHLYEEIVETNFVAAHPRP
jgi:hypothetical protein